MTEASADAVRKLPVLSELADATFFDDPAIAFRAAHAAQGPGIFRMPSGDGLIITAHRTLDDLKNHPALGAQHRGSRRAGSGGLGALARMDRNGPFFMNEPLHTPMALATYRPMSPARTQSLSEALERIARRAVERMLAADDDVDLVAEYALVIARDFWLEFLGLPEEATDTLMRSSAAIVPMLKFSNTPEEIDAANQLAEEQWALLEVHYEKTRGRTQTTLFDMLAPAIDACDLPGAPRNAAALVAAISFDGLHSVAGATANVLYTCLSHPDQWALIAEDPGLIRGAWREAVRYEPSFIGLHRGALEDIEYEGVLIPGGANVVTAWGIANRDPRVFDDPDRFDISRSTRQCLSFGGGSRICKGRHLAMLQGEIALRTLIECTRSIELLPEAPDWGEPGLLRSIRRIPVRIR
jgi:cytochrome P450